MWWIQTGIVARCRLVWPPGSWFWHNQWDVTFIRWRRKRQNHSQLNKKYNINIKTTDYRVEYSLIFSSILALFLLWLCRLWITSSYWLFFGFLDSDWVLAITQGSVLFEYVFEKFRLVNLSSRTEAHLGDGATRKDKGKIKLKNYNGNMQLLQPHSEIFCFFAEKYLFFIEHQFEVHQLKSWK